jgi:enoyl-CoA hydratase/carnithine racemase
MSKLTITRNQGVASIVINNPPANILTTDLIDEVNAFVLSLTDDPDTRVVVFKSGNEKFFSAHLDLNVINATQEGQAACVKFSRMIKNIKAMQQLSIAFVDGIARGGGNEFVMACDLAYGSPVAGGCGPRACSRTLAGASPWLVNQRCGKRGGRLQMALSKLTGSPL